MNVWMSFKMKKVVEKKKKGKKRKLFDRVKPLFVESLCDIELLAESSNQVTPARSKTLPHRLRMNQGRFWQYFLVHMRGR
jgi:hypothetical protein